ncbi:MAG: hypothetical protein ACR2Q4_16125 [Geminicoccaceae bacterium]
MARLWQALRFRTKPTESSYALPNGLKKCLAAFDQDSTLVAVVEMSQSNWLVAGIVPGVERQPLKKLKVNEQALLELLDRWRDEALKAGRKFDKSFQMNDIERLK